MDPVSLKGSRTGVFQGSCFPEYHKDYRDAISKIHQLPNQVTLISRFFELKGPYAHFDTACASGASALNEAYHALQRGLCDQAIVTGANSLFQPIYFYEMLDLKMISRDGKSKCMDASANGYARGEAVVAIFLQKKCHAKRIYASILNCKSNTDGWKAEGVTFPGQSSQSQLLRNTYSEIGLNPLDFKYIEAHTTGTAAGDPVELNAIYDVLCADRSEDNPLLVGCLKSCIGHTEGTSGLCALVKSLLILQNGKIPPNLHMKSPNLNIKGLADGRMKPVTDVINFDQDIIPINCFGFGGANVHFVIQAHKQQIHPISSDCTVDLPRLVQVCGRTREATNHLLDTLLNSSVHRTREFLDLLTNFSKQSPSNFPYRAFALLQDDSVTSDQVKCMCRVDPVLVAAERKQVCILFKQQSLSSSLSLLKSCNLLRQLKDFSDVLSRIGVDLDECLKKSQLSLREHVILNLSIQMAMVDLLNDMNVAIDFYSGSGFNELACGYADGILTSEQVILAANCALLNVTPGDLDEGLSRIIHRRDVRSNRWISDSPSITSSSYFAQHILKTNRSLNNVFTDKMSPLDNIVIEIGSWGLKFPGQSTGDTTTDTFNVIGKLYTEGFDTAIDKLYPRVNYPLPTVTPSLSPLIEWNHEHSYTLDTRTIELNENKQAVISQIIPFTFSQSNPEDAFLFDHKIDGRILFPATGYLAMAWYTLAQMKLKSIFDVPVKFTDVAIQRATVMSSGKQVRFTCTMMNNSGSFVVKDGDTVVAGGKMQVIDEFNNQPILDESSDSSETLTMSLNDIYKEFRVRGYDYDPYFQGLHSAQSDGSHGKVIWRQIATQSALDALNTTSDDDKALIWLRSWIMFADSLIQLTLLDSENVGRALLVPTKLESLICSPKTFVKCVENSETIQDSITMSRGKLVNCSYRHYEDVIECNGLILKGLKVSLLKRNQQMVRCKKYQFIPLEENEAIDESLKAYILSYHTQCRQLAQLIECNGDASNCQVNLPLDEPKHALLKLLHSALTNQVNNDSGVDLSNDLLLGSHGDVEHYSSRFLKPLFDLVTYNVITRPSFNKLDVLEVSSSTDFTLKATLEDLMDDSLFNDQCNINVNCLHSYEYKTDKKLASAHLTVYHETDPDAPEKEQLIRDMFNETTNGGFLLILGRDEEFMETQSMNEIIKTLEKSLNVKVPQYVNIQQLVDLAQSAGFTVITKKYIIRDTLAYAGVLLRKVNNCVKEDIQITVDLDDYENWLTSLQELISERQDNSENNKRVWLVPKYNESGKKGVCGLTGFVKSLRLEPGGDCIRCIIDWTANKQINIFDEEYQQIRDNDLVYNVRFNHQNGWGTYEHLAFDENPTREELCRIKNVYLKSLKPGDLSSLMWIESNIDKSVELDNWIDVHYAPLNFKCVMYATGRLSVDSVHGIDPRVAQDSLLGIEFAGYDRNGNRIMGVVPYKGFSTRIPMDENIFLLPVPESWSLEDASTVSVVYSTAMYGLVMRGKLTKGESVLIHSAAGGVGLAAVNIAMSKQCTIYVTVGTEEKKNYLLREFPSLPVENIFYSRDTSFEEDVMKATGGRGVDVVLNSLSGPLLQASLRCVAVNGRFIEIGKADLIADIDLHSWQVDGNRSIHGVYPESFFRYNSKQESQLSRRTAAEKAQLQKLIRDGMMDGTIKPLLHTVFDMNNIDEAFKYMFTGKHMGKVIIKMNSIETLSTRKVVKTTHFYPNKSYLVIGGLGGFGLEVVQWLTERGANKIILNSRRGVRDIYHKYCLQRLESSGIRVIVSQADSTSEQGIEELIKLSQSLAPVGGIFNTAAVFDDMLLTDQTTVTFESVCLPKAKASLLLDEYTRRHSDEFKLLDYFVTFSSISGGRGNPGQTSYNFANSIMDTLAENRRASGLHGLSIQWGVIADTGYVAEKANSNNTVILGLTGQRMHSCLVSFDQFLQSNDAIVTCYVKAEKSTGSDSVATADIIKVVSRILGLKDMNALDPNTTLGSLGIDSLIAVEIQQILERILESSVTLKQIKEMKISEFMAIATKSS